MPAVGPPPSGAGYVTRSLLGSTSSGSGTALRPTTGQIYPPPGIGEPGPQGPPGEGGGSAGVVLVHGDATATTYRLAHNLGTEGVVVQVLRLADRFVVYPDVRVVDANEVDVIYAEPPGENAMRATVR